jgi:hypothetical protein
MNVRDLITQLLTHDMESEIVSRGIGDYYFFVINGVDSGTATQNENVVIMRTGDIFDMREHEIKMNEKDEDTTPTKCHLCLNEFPANQTRDMSENFADMPVEICINCLAEMVKQSHSNN